MLTLTFFSFINLTLTFFSFINRCRSSFVLSGTVTVNDDSTVQIIAEEAVPVSDLDQATAKAGLDAFTAKLTTVSDAEKAEAQIGVEVHTAMPKALGSE